MLRNQEDFNGEGSPPFLPFVAAMPKSGDRVEKGLIKEYNRLEEWAGTCMEISGCEFGYEEIIAMRNWVEAHLTSSYSAASGQGILVVQAGKKGGQPQLLALREAAHRQRFAIYEIPNVEDLDVDAVQRFHDDKGICVVVANDRSEHAKICSALGNVFGVLLYVDFSTSPEVVKVQPFDPNHDEAVFSTSGSTGAKKLCYQKTKQPCVDSKLYEQDLQCLSCQEQPVMVVVSGAAWPAARDAELRMAMSARSSKIVFLDPALKNDHSSLWDKLQALDVSVVALLPEILRVGLLLSLIHI